MELGYIYSRMGRATESHFAVLNKKIQDRKTEATTFDPEKVLNPALRTNKNPVMQEDKKELAKIKKMFLDANYKRHSVKDQVQGYIKKDEVAKISMP